MWWFVLLGFVFWKEAIPTPQNYSEDLLLLIKIYMLLFFCVLVLFLRSWRTLWHQLWIFLSKRRDLLYDSYCIQPILQVSEIEVCVFQVLDSNCLQTTSALRFFKEVTVETWDKGKCPLPLAVPHSVIHVQVTCLACRDKERKIHMYTCLTGTRVLSYLCVQEDIYI